VTAARLTSLESSCRVDRYRIHVLCPPAKWQTLCQRLAGSASCPQALAFLGLVPDQWDLPVYTGNFVMRPIRHTWGRGAALQAAVAAQSKEGAGERERRSRLDLLGT
jgi:hypothetical protein